MKLLLNGEDREFDNVRTLAELIEKLGMKPDRVAVERNRAIVPRAEWSSTQLAEGDRLEIVQFVGGGCSLPR
jgi:thiamine biosynthesis protein ThiS